MINTKGWIVMVIVLLVILSVGTYIYLNRSNDESFVKSGIFVSK